MLPNRRCIFECDVLQGIPVAIEWLDLYAECDVVLAHTSKSELDDVISLLQKTLQTVKSRLSKVGFRV